METTDLFKPLKGAKLWIVGLVALVVMSTLTFIIPMHTFQSEQVSGWLTSSGSQVGSERMDTAEGLLWAHLTYFGGVTFSKSERLGNISSHTAIGTRSNLFLGGAILILAFLWGCALTRKSYSSWLAVVPIWVYSLASVIYVGTRVSDGGTGAKFVWFTVLFWMLVVTLAAAFIASRLAVWLANRGTRFFDMLDIGEDEIRPYFCTACGSQDLLLDRKSGAWHCKKCGGTAQYLPGTFRTVQCPKPGCGSEISVTVHFCPWCGGYVRDEPQMTARQQIGV